ncbi:23S rRNA (cytidine1920-2'-O)/16S rRNA (cytidine1409-2'-O)-methyltransferase [Microbacterium terrae]|uniref:16S/23S rRNA (Cytidine-2'-O)-methyltransferase TlyA n=1 Tax=Microbacterium terrae TaxID=69369 RepID=A0A0M2HAT1_9MICO|nr:TlyA family RNA methyltransferase [Microbacterium terrae]KJL41288.1 16S/23S rRNA (cytidine-2'-O)-methyltransferase TlyA [Microbacterium terrae]MBP1077674.1 23S rRNA (cytidine1920-2'-O)/16S rRNA (cytidine1409-2'-O)-methyltransferase [Microbacterium terrae]GLJ99280.1 TlyA family rRNA (cytidine-2'-O)-methyltransferase [Microbacterium terrae]
MTARLDAALAERGLARSRTHAATLIADGLVSVDGRPVVKASAKVDDDALIEVAGADHYVSRAAHKLIAGLDAFGVEVRGAVALDMGASTGGFTQVLRERGADPVIAVDVGHGQLAPSIAADAGVIAVEGFNVRYMTPASLAEAARTDAAPAVITGDLSFISLTHVLPAARSVAAPGADLVLLIKPQFEVGRTAVKGGLVTNPTLRADAVAGVLWAAWDAGLGTCGIVSSPIAGTHGNAEYIAHLALGRGSNPTEWLSTVNRLAGSP